jgi:hypothetical protein
VVVASPLTGVVERLAADDHCTGRHHLGEHLPAHPWRVEVWVPGDGFSEPLVQPVPAVSEPIARAVVRAADEPVEGHRHIQDGLRHLISFLGAW